MQLTKLTMLGYINRIIILVPFFAFGNVQDTIKTIDLENVVVKSTKINTIQKQAPLSVTLKSFTEDKNFSSQSSFSDFIKNTPGLFTTSSNNFSQDLRISIRGFGARSSFGIRGIKIIVDGIPQTSPDGQTQLDNLPIGIMESLEVIRGPAANLYGNSSGGVITINTISGDGQNKTNYKAIFGAYDYKSVMRLKTFNWDKTYLVVYYDTKESNGYREFSGFKNRTINLKLSHRFSKKSNLICLADDSGLEIDILNKRPGVKSARWGGTKGDFNKAIKRVVAGNFLLLSILAYKLSLGSNSKSSQEPRMGMTLAEYSSFPEE